VVVAKIIIVMQNAVIPTKSYRGISLYITASLGIIGLRLIMGEITYDDIKRNFSKEDLAQYNSLSKEFVTLVGNKSNSELWNMLQNLCRLRVVLDDIHILRDKYDFSKGSLFFNVWRMNPSTKKVEEMR